MIDYLKKSREGRFGLTGCPDRFLGGFPVVDKGGVHVDDGSICELKDKTIAVYSKLQPVFVRPEL